MRSLLVIGYVWPEPSSSAAGTRMMQLLDFFKSNGYSIIFATTAKESENMENLQELGIITKAIELNNPSFDDFVKILQPEIVLFDRFMMEEQFGWRIKENCPDALNILDTEDLHCLRHYRELTLMNKGSSLKDLDITKREIASIYRCDLSLIISEAEMEILLKKFNIPANLLEYLPLLFSKISSEERADLPDFEDRQDFIAIGNFLHRPNVDAVIYLKKEIWPLIKLELPETKMNIFGAYSSVKIEQLNSPKDNFLIKGRANVAAEEVRKSRVSLAAIRFGAGLKGKLAEAMVCGTPSVTTPIGAEGMKGEYLWPGAITETPEEFAKAAVNLYTNKTSWKKAQTTGFQIINKRFSRGEHLLRFKKRLEKLRNHLDQHRQKNFIGSMLTHHRSRSTYFLSRYIETKNLLEKERNK